MKIFEAQLRSLEDSNLYIGSWAEGKEKATYGQQKKQSLKLAIGNISHHWLFIC